MTELARPDLHAAIEQRYPDNSTERITPELLRDGLHELVDSVLVKASDGGAVPNVPLYQAGTDYAKDYTVRYPTGTGVEAFYYSLRAGKLPAPSGSSTDVNWKVVPGPVSTAALSQQMTLLEAQGIEGSQVVPGRTYLIDFGPDANGYAQVVTLVGTAANLFAIRGQLTVNGVRSNVRVNVASGVFGQEVSNLLDTANTWKERQTFLKGLGLYNGAGFDEYGQLSVGQILLADKFLWRGAIQKMAQDTLVGWSPDDYAGQGHGPDTGLSRAEAGVVEVNIGTPGDLGQLRARDVVATDAIADLNSLVRVAEAVEALRQAQPQKLLFERSNLTDTRVNPATGALVTTAAAKGYVVMRDLVMEPGLLLDLRAIPPQFVEYGAYFCDGKYLGPVLNVGLPNGQVSSTDGYTYGEYSRVPQLPLDTTSYQVVLRVSSRQLPEVLVVTPRLLQNYSDVALRKQLAAAGNATPGASTFAQLGGAPRDNAALASELAAVQSLSDGRRDLVTIASNRFNDLVLERKVTLTALKLATNASSVSAQVLAEGSTAVSSPRTGSPADLLAALQADINGLASWDYYIIRFQTTPGVSTDVTHVLLTITA
jgi:hypothetical protein